MENKINKKNDILIFIDAKKKGINSRLKKRINYNKTEIEVKTERKFLEKIFIRKEQ